MVFSLQPDMIVSNRNMRAGDFDTPGQRIEAAEAGRAWDQYVVRKERERGQA
jgi:hypothetical protein